MAGGRLGGRRKDRLRQSVALSQPLGQPLTGDRPAPLVVLPTRPRNIAAYHALEQDGLGHHHPHAALLEVRLLAEDRGWDRQVGGKVVADQAGRLPEPGEGQLIQDPAFFRDRGWQHDVECGDSVGRHHQEFAIAQAVRIAHLSL